MTSPTTDSRVVICDVCGHLLANHHPSKPFPGMLSCVECPDQSAICLVPQYEQVGK